MDKGGIVLLQETHVKDTDNLSSIWKHNFESNCKKTNAAGLIILYNKDFSIVEKHNDGNGRLICIAIEKDEIKLIIANVYFPNDHREGMVFAEDMYLKILDLQHRLPEYHTILGGDFNLCMNNNDSLNRNSSSTEKHLSVMINDNNKITSLTDCYRLKNNEGRFTWKRGNCYSRLDYIFASASLLSKITKVEFDWAFETSDHASVQTDFNSENIPTKGPGIVKVNTRILEDPKVVEQIRIEIESMISQTDQSWSPHSKLEFLKVVIRTVFSVKVSEIRKKSTQKYLN